jgi:hypothetical protein
VFFFTDRDHLTLQLIAQRAAVRCTSLAAIAGSGTDAVSADHLFRKAGLLRAGRHSAANSIAAIPALIAA